MVNDNWVCFECRVVTRRGRYPRGVGEKPCPSCGQPLRCIGTKLAVPKQSDERGWRQLLARMTDFAEAIRERETARGVREQHAIEQRIAALERQPKNKDRGRLIKSLRQQLPKSLG